MDSAWLGRESVRRRVRWRVRRWLEDVDRSQQNDYGRVLGEVGGNSALDSFST